MIENRRSFFRAFLASALALGFINNSKSVGKSADIKEKNFSFELLNNVYMYVGAAGKKPDGHNSNHAGKTVDGKSRLVLFPLFFDSDGFCNSLSNLSSMDIPELVSIQLIDLSGREVFLDVDFESDKIFNQRFYASNKNISRKLASSGPYIILGRANIKNPRWNAPCQNASDPDAAQANSVAINSMLVSGNKYVELDDSTRHVCETLTPQDSITIVGAGRSVTSLIWSGGDRPIIGRYNFHDPDSHGISNVRLIDLKMKDCAQFRSKYYSVDLSNGNSCGLERCWLDGGIGHSANDKYGVFLGTALHCKNKTIKSFVSHFRDSRLSMATLVMNTTDYYISGAELWGNNRLNAVELGGGGTITGGTQIVPGRKSGIFLFSEAGYDIDTLKIIGVYFDGSTDQNLFTGWGILSDKNIGLVSAEIIGCNFWHINEGGVNVERFYSSTLESNFRDCDSDDTGESDILIKDVFSSYIYNRHFRSVPPKSISNRRENVSPPYVLNGKSGYPLSSVGGQIGFSSCYSDNVCVPAECFEFLGGGARTTNKYTKFPAVQDFKGKIVNVNDKPYFSNGMHYIALSQDANKLTKKMSVDKVMDSGCYFIEDKKILSSNEWGANLRFPVLLNVTRAGENVIIQKIQSVIDGSEMVRYNSGDGWNN